MSNRHRVPAQIWWYGCYDCRCIKAMYQTAPALCFACCMELAVEHLANCEGVVTAGGEGPCCCDLGHEVCEGICETDGCTEAYLFDEDDDNTQSRCFECWARAQVDARMRPEEEDEEEDEDEAD